MPRNPSPVPHSPELRVETDTLQEQSLTDMERTGAALARFFPWIFALFALSVFLIPLKHTIELWDESRIANNAIETALAGHWLAPTYGFVVDHWNTKPPLLIWIIAALERAGLPPLMALRLPSELAALSAVLLVYGFCLKLLRRPLVAVMAALIMMASTLYFGLHMAQSGDYDALLCLLTTVYTLGFFAYVEGIRPSLSMTVAVAALVLAVLTKGIAGVLLLPGLMVYLVARGRLLRAARDPRFWAGMVAAAGLCALYYVGRDRLVDPGYLQTVWSNELGGRFAQANEGHHAKVYFYAVWLMKCFEPGILLVLLGWLPLRRRATAAMTPDDRLQLDRTYAAALFTACTALVFLTVLTISKTKIFYYCCPAIPLLSILAALGVADGIRLLREKQHTGIPAAGRPRLETIVVALLTLAVGVACLQDYTQGASVSGGEQASYGDLLKTVYAASDHSGQNKPVLLVDPGFDTNAHFVHYDPVADYYAKEARFKGHSVNVAIELPSTAAGVWVATCSPEIRQQITALPASRTITFPQGATCAYALR